MIAARSGRLSAAILLGFAVQLGTAAPADGQAVRSSTNCVACHGELELLRQHVPSPARARELLVTDAQMRGSGHDNIACGECHTNYGTFPHPAARTSTATCASCHQPADTAWASGRHALIVEGGGIAATCASCHGVHGVATAAALAEPAARRAMNAECVTCHQTAALPASDPHALEVGCWTCHAPHEVHAIDEPDARVAPANQAQTCGACHEEAAGNWAEDAHGAALRQSLAAGAVHSLPPTRDAPACTACHGGHGMVAAESEAFAAFSVDRCAACHQNFADTYFGTYHGKATTLGSRIAASCADCHGSHAVFAQDDPRSLVHEANMLATCGDCHPNARPAFILYDSHPELLNWRRNPILTGSFVMMNALLAFVFLVFGSHTVLWWIRLFLDRRRGVGHGHGPPHPPSQPEGGAHRTAGTEAASQRHELAGAPPDGSRRGGAKGTSP